MVHRSFFKKLGFSIFDMKGMWPLLYQTSLFFRINFSVLVLALSGSEFEGVCDVLRPPLNPLSLSLFFFCSAWSKHFSNQPNISTDCFDIKWPSNTPLLIIPPPYKHSFPLHPSLFIMPLLIFITPTPFNPPPPSVYQEIPKGYSGCNNYRTLIKCYLSQVLTYMGVYYFSVKSQISCTDGKSKLRYSRWKKGKICGKPEKCTITKWRICCILLSQIFKVDK